MIPAPISPLTGLSVLVTRPQTQAARLRDRIVAAGGEAIVFPTIAIAPVEVAQIQSTSLQTSGAVPPHDIVIFASANAVQHGLARVQRGPNTRFAAIGPATAAALAAAHATVDLLPEAGFDSEGLLAAMRPLLESAPLQSAQSVRRVLIVRGEGGRECLQEQIVQFGVQVESLEVYQRILPSVDAAALQRLEEAWANPGIGIVTATSVETLRNLLRLVPGPRLDLLKSTPLLTVSARISQAARELGWRAECFVASGADEDSLLGALAAWHTRARANTDCFIGTRI